jgi:hypothetical protein
VSAPESSREELLAEVARLRAQLAAQPFIPPLPEQHEGDSIEWRPWEPLPVVSHIDPACLACDHPGPQVGAMGIAASDGLIRFNATRCPACQEMRVYQRTYDKYRVGARLVEIAYHPPRTIVRSEEAAGV